MKNRRDKENPRTAARQTEPADNSLDIGYKLGQIES